MRRNLRTRLERRRRIRERLFEEKPDGSIGRFLTIRNRFASSRIRDSRTVAAAFHRPQSTSLASFAIKLNITSSFLVSLASILPATHYKYLYASNFTPITLQTANTSSCYLTNLDILLRYARSSLA